jgi:hypothetical protein
MMANGRIVLAGAPKSWLGKRAGTEYFGKWKISDGAQEVKLRIVDSGYNSAIIELNGTPRRSVYG